MSSGSLTSAISVAAVLIRPLAGRMSRVLGLKRLLLPNSVLSAAMVAASATFGAAASHLVLVAAMMLLGVVRTTPFDRTSSWRWGERAGGTAFMGPRR